MQTLLRTLSLALALLCAPVAARAQDFSGWWVAQIEHNGETEPLYLHFDTSGGRDVAYFSAPVVRMYEINAGPRESGANEVRLPGLGWTLAVREEGRVLEGVLPVAIVPHHQMLARFERTSALAPPRDITPSEQAPASMWSVNVGAPVWAGLAHDPRRNMLYVAAETGRVTALNARNGATRWSADLAAPIRATPTLHERRLYVATDAALHALDARTGRAIWSAPFGPERAPRLPMSDSHSNWDHYSASAVIDGGAAYVGSRDGCMYALNARTGAQLWRTCTEALVTGAPALTHDALYFGGFDGNAYALSRADGSEIWRYNTHAAISRDAIIANGNVLIGSRTYDLIALNTQTGQPAWTRYFWYSWIDSPPVLRDGALYVGSSDALAVQAFDAATGARLWSAPVPGWSWPRVAVTDRAVYASIFGGGEYIAPRTGALAAIDRVSGALRWLYPPAPAAAEGDLYGFASAPVADGQRVFAADLAGNVTALDDSAARQH